jgi:hypothetical protein
MLQFLIRPNEEQWFSVPANSLATVCMPQCVAAEPSGNGEGDYCFMIGAVEVACSYEDPGLHIVFDGEIERALAHQVVEEILANVTRITGQAGRVVLL